MDESRDRENQKQALFENTSQAKRPCLPATEGAREISLEVRGRRLSFREAITKAEEQVDFCGMDYADVRRPLVHDMCRAMAEVYMSPPDMMLKCCGELMEAGMIAEVFAELTEEHVQNLAARLYSGWCAVGHPKAYLRSALYNVVFEFESVITREVLSDFGPW